jgi:hypothetical protein
MYCIVFWTRPSLFFQKGRASRRKNFTRFNMEPEGLHRTRVQTDMPEYRVKKIRQYYNLSYFTLWVRAREIPLISIEILKQAFCNYVVDSLQRIKQYECTVWLHYTERKTRSPVSTHICTKTTTKFAKSANMTQKNHYAVSKTQNFH